VLLDTKQDPRELDRQQQASREAKRQQEQVQALTVSDAWAMYLQERRAHWGERHYSDHLKMSAAGGEPTKRGVKLEPGKPRPLKQPGPVYSLLALRLAELTPDVVEAWAAEQAKTRPTYARLCWRCLKVFLNWCAEQASMAQVMPAKNPATTKKARETLGRANVKTDALMREQLPAWFDAVRQIQNPAIAAALQITLLTGARPGEVLAMRWQDVNTQWRGLTIRDKVEGERVIPLTPYVAKLLAELPRRNAYVFASVRPLQMDAHNVERRAKLAAQRGEAPAQGDVMAVGEKGHMAPPNHAHAQACKVSGIQGLSLHGLRRSFKSLTEWLDIPAGVVAQIMGHKPSATAEKHYTVRPLDLLRVHHERIEAWILEQAGVQFHAETGKLRVVA
jgi:integrase